MSRLEPIVGLPSKKSKTSRSNNRVKYKNKCEICKTIFKSVDDNKLKKEYGKQNTWIGCNKGCDYWAHARCVNIVIPDSNKRKCRRRDIFMS